MKPKSSFKNQMLGVYFNINGLRHLATGGPSDEALQPAEAIYIRAYEKLEQSLPKSRWWLKRDEVNPDITYSPFEICEESLDAEVVEGTDGVLGFSFWLYSYHMMHKTEVLAFRNEVIAAFQTAADELGGEAQFMQVESRITEEVITTTLIDPDQSPD